MKYQYEIQCDKLVSMRLVKYKYNDGDLIENVDIALLHVPKKDLSVVKVQLPETGNCIFEGFLLRGKSHINKINKLSCKLVVFTFTKDKRIDKHLLKMQVFIN